MNLSKLVVPMVTGLVLSAAVVSAQAQTPANDATTDPNQSQTRDTAAESNLNGTTNPRDTGTGLNDDRSTTNRVTAADRTADEEAARDEMRVARADRN